MYADGDDGWNDPTIGMNAPYESLCEECSSEDDGGEGGAFVFKLEDDE